MIHLRRVLSAILFLSIGLACSSSALAQKQDRAEVEKKIEALRAELARYEKELLAPSLEDRAAFAVFLQQPDTGLTRLMPREKYGNKLNVREGGSFYSFRLLAHEYGYGSDILLEQNQFSVGFAGANYRFIVGLGDTPLQDVTLDHPAIRFMAEYAVPPSMPGVRGEYRRFHSGVDSNGFRYVSRIGAVDNTTYALRSIEIGDGDAMVAFRVVRRDGDGSLTLAWKILKRFPAPNVTRDNEPQT